VRDPRKTALELHNRRRVALHEELDYRKSISVLDWGQTDDSDPHEYVELILSAFASSALSYVIVPGLEFIGKKFAEKAVDEASSRLVQAIVSWLRPEQEKEKLLDFSIALPNGTMIRVDPPQGSGSITISFADNKVSSINYLTGVETSQR